MGKGHEFYICLVAALAPFVAAACRPGTKSSGSAVVKAAAPDAADETGDAGPEKTADALDKAVAALEGAIETDCGDLRKEAVAALGLIGPPAAGAAPAVIRLAGDPDIKPFLIRNTLEKLGPGAVPSLVEALGDGGPDERDLALETLMDLEQSPGGALPAIAALLDEARKEKDSKLAGKVAGALGAFGADGTSLLLPLLDDENVPLRIAAIEALAAAGPRASEALPALIKALDDADGGIRLAAAGALGKIGQGSKEALDALVAKLEEKEPDMRRKATKALGDIGPEAEKAIPLLIKDLKTLQEPMCLPAMDALAKIGAASVPSLIEALGSKKPGVRIHALQILSDMGPGAGSALPALVTILKKGSALEAEMAATAISSIGPKAAPAVPELVKTLGSGKSGRLTVTVIRALGAIGPEAAISLPALVDAMGILDPGQPDIHVEAMIAIGKIDPNYVVPAKKFVKALGDKDPDVRGRAAAVLGLTGAVEALPDLLKLLSDEKSAVRIAACAAIAKMGPKAAAAEGDLRKAMKDEDWRVQEGAVRALGAVGPAAAAALPDLLDALKGGYIVVRGASAAPRAAILPGDPSAQHAVIEALGDEYLVATTAVDALAAMGTRVLPELGQALLVDKVAVRKGAAAALGKMEPPPRDALPDLLKVMKNDADCGVRAAAAAAVGSILSIEREEKAAGF
jgi:HEAT repeat protein